MPIPGSTLRVATIFRLDGLAPFSIHSNIGVTRSTMSGPLPPFGVAAQ